MLCILEIIETLASVVSSTGLLLFHIFSITCYFGDILLCGVVSGVVILQNIVLNAQIVIEVLCDDYSVFLKDFLSRSIAVALFAKNGIVELVHLVITSASLTVDIGYELVKSAVCGLLSICQILSDFVSFVIDVAKLPYLSISYVGTSLLETFNSLPGNIKHGFIYVSQELMLLIEDCKTLIVVTLYGTVVRFLKSQFEATLLILQSSTSTFFGFLIGVTTISFIGFYFKDIASFVWAITESLIDNLCIFVCNCWTGEFFYRGNRSDRQQLQRGDAPVVRNPQREETLCIVCLSNPKNVLHMPCRHVCVCQECSDILGPSCPVCRMRIRKRINVFI